MTWRKNTVIQRPEKGNDFHLHKSTATVAQYSKHTNMPSYSLLSNTSTISAQSNHHKPPYGINARLCICTYAHIVSAWQGFADPEMKSLMLYITALRRAKLKIKPRKCHLLLAGSIDSCTVLRGSRLVLTVNPPGLLVMCSTVVAPYTLSFVVALLCCFTFKFPRLSQQSSSVLFNNFNFVCFHLQEWISFFRYGIVLYMWLRL